MISIAQCGSGTQDSSTPDPAQTSETAPPASEPIVDEPPPAAPAPMLEPEPAPEPEPIPEPAYESAPEPAYVPDYSDDDSSSSGSAYYKNCTAAQAAGVTPLYAGDPGYASNLDRDGDGVACEN
ncbi:MAG: excalibur calcium-binding domain-containing protein [Pseudonocardiaceae bacterium]